MLPTTDVPSAKYAEMRAFASFVFAQSNIPKTQKSGQKCVGSQFYINIGGINSICNLILYTT